MLPAVAVLEVLEKVLVVHEDLGVPPREAEKLAGLAHVALGEARHLRSPGSGGADRLRQISPRFYNVCISGLAFLDWQGVRPGWHTLRSTAWHHAAQQSRVAHVYSTARPTCICGVQISLACL